MNINSAKLVYFSPTKTTKTIVEAIAGGMQIDRVEHLDLTLPDAETRQVEEMHDGLAIIGAPVYGGRVPLDAISRLQRIKANDTPAVIVVLYGNREYDDALLELKDLAFEAGFIPVAGGAFIGEHSFSSDTLPIANGRPDAEDLKKARAFGRMIREKLKDIQSANDMAPLQVPGNFPYKERSPSARISPVTKEDLCTKCETCAAACPTGAIRVDGSVMTDPDLCIRCCACIKDCPTGARVMEAPQMKQIAERLSKNFQERKEPVTFMID